MQPEQQRDLQQGLFEIHRKTKFLPPGIDCTYVKSSDPAHDCLNRVYKVTGQVEKTSDIPVAYGGYNDVYTGKFGPIPSLIEWLIELFFRALAWRTKGI